MMSLFKKRKKIDNVYGFLHNISETISIFSNDDNFLELSRSLRKLIGNIFTNFDYEIWFYDKFDDKRDEVLFSVYKSNEMIASDLKEVYKSFTTNEVFIIKSSGLKKTFPKYVKTLYAPVGAGSERIGVLGIYLYEHLFSENDAYMKLLGTQLFLTIKDFFFRLEKNIFAEIKEMLSNTDLSHDLFLKNLTILIANSIPCEGCSLFLFDESNETLYLEASTGLFNAKDKRYKYNLGEGLTGWVGLHKKNLRIRNIDDVNERSLIGNDLQWSNKYSEIEESINPNFKEWHSYLAVPIFEKKSDRKLLGTIRLSKRRYGEGFLSNEEHILNEIAKFLSSYYFNFVNEQYKKDFLFLTAIEASLASAQTDPIYILSNILTYISQITQTNDGYIAILNNDQRTFSTLVVHGHQLEKRTSQKYSGKGIVGAAAEQRKIIFVNTSEERTRFGIEQNTPIKANQLIQSEIAIPLILKNRVIGIINLHSDLPDKFKPREFARLKMLADITAVNYDYASRFFSSKSRLSAFIKILENIGGQIELSKFYESVVKELVNLTKGKCAALLLLDNNKDTLIVEDVFNYNNLLPDFPLTAGKGISWKCVLEKRIIHWYKDTTDLDVEPVILDPELFSEIALPIMYNNEPLGCICIGFDDLPKLAFDEDNLSILELLASQIGLFIVSKKMISEKELIDRKREKLERSIILSTFISGIAHDFHNKLEKIKIGQKNIAEEIKKQIDEKEYQKIILQIQELNNVIADLHLMTLKLKRYQTDKAQKIEECYINKIILSAVNILQPYADEKKIKIKVKLSSDLDKPKTGKGNFILCDFDNMDRAIENILKNAIEHSYPRQNVDVESKLIRSQGKFDYDIFEIKITDYGMGIPDENKERIFDYDFTTKDYGTGLGLYTARNSIEKAGGIILLDTKVGKGTIFTIRFGKS